MASYEDEYGFSEPTVELTPETIENEILPYVERDPAVTVDGVVDALAAVWGPAGDEDISAVFAHMRKLGWAMG